MGQRVVGWWGCAGTQAGGLAAWKAGRAGMEAGLTRGPAGRQAGRRRLLHLHTLRHPSPTSCPQGLAPPPASGWCSLWMISTCPLVSATARSRPLSYCASFKTCGAWRFGAGRAWPQDAKLRVCLISFDGGRRAGH